MAECRHVEVPCWPPHHLLHHAPPDYLAVSSAVSPALQLHACLPAHTADGAALLPSLSTPLASAHKLTSWVPVQAMLEAPNPRHSCWKQASHRAASRTMREDGVGSGVSRRMGKSAFSASASFLTQMLGSRALPSSSTLSCGSSVFTCVRITPHIRHWGCDQASCKAWHTCRLRCSYCLHGTEAHRRCSTCRQPRHVSTGWGDLPA